MRLALLTAPALAVVLAACGAGHRAPRPPTAACSVHLYFASGATRSQERFVGSKLRRDSQVWRVTYVSKAQALAKMKRKFPALFTQPLPSNPLPDSFVVVPLDPSHTSAVGHSFAGTKWPGVANVLWKSRAPCG